MGGQAAGLEDDPVLVGAGDIASCGRTGDEATAGLLDGIDGTVATLGDNVYEIIEKGSTAKLVASISYDSGTHAATLDPTDPLRTGITYKAVVTAGAKDLVGNRLDQNGTKTGSQPKT